MTLSRSAPDLALPDFLGPALLAGHPWVYRDHVPRSFSAPSGSWVTIVAGRFRAVALWDATSPIALRVFSRNRVPDAAWIRERVAEALELRQRLASTRTDAFRWINGEGDGLPGLVVDRYAGFAVLELSTPALQVLLPWVVDALWTETRLEGVLQRTQPGEIVALRGSLPPERVLVQEHGVRYGVDLRFGQKTGLFLDQRENRAAVAEFSAGARMLNLFSYTGGFSLHAALAGAQHLTSVDSAAPAMAAARENFELNGLDPEPHAFVVADVFEDLEARSQKDQASGQPGFDVVVCDPPSFARNRTQLSRAKRAYVRLNALALRAVAPRGIFAAGSCTSQVSPELFRELLAEAARRAGRRLQIVHEAGHALDHPIQSGHPEGRYLKFIIGRVLDPV